MCKKATCSTCNKISWWGCGSHVATVLADVPEEQLCTCEPRVEKGGKEYPPMAK